MNKNSEPEVNNSLKYHLDKSAYDTLMKLEPNLIKLVGQLLDKKQSPIQIARSIQNKDISLAAIVEMAAGYMLTTGVRP